MNLFHASLFQTRICVSNAVKYDKRNILQQKKGEKKKLSAKLRVQSLKGETTCHGSRCSTPSGIR